jgi:putative colanic acid biosynthesis glycosyltransferase
MPALLQINTVANIGSTGQIAEQLGQIAIKKGWKFYMAYGRQASKSSSVLIQIGGKFSVLSHLLVSRIFDKHGLGSKIATHSFIKEIDKIKPDIVHIHNMHGYFLNYPMLMKYLSDKNIPTVITLHDFWMLTGHCAYINDSCEKWKTGCGKCPRLKQYPTAFIDNSKNNWVTKDSIFRSNPNITLVPVSYWLKSFVDQSLLNKLDIQVIQNGINTNEFKPYDAKVHSDIYNKIDWSKFTIMTIAARWSDANGYGDIMSLSRILLEDAQIIMVGLSKEQITELPSNIIGICKTNNVSQLTELYTSADVMFNASKEVTFGLVTAEAMACGTPVIVYRNTAGEEIIDEKTGFVVDSVSEIPILIQKIRKTPALSLLCRKRVQDNFEADRQYKKYIDLYDSKICKRLQ